MNRYPLGDFDPYEELQVSRNASDEVIGAAFRRLARIYHPDAGESGDSEKMARLSVAYRLLSDPARRRAFDMAFDRQRSGDSSAAAGGTADSAPPTPTASAHRNAPTAPADLPADSILSRVWGRVGGLLLTVGVLAGIGWCTAAVQEQDARDQITSQNSAAESRPLTTSPNSLADFSDAGNESGTRSIFDLRTGDCLADPGSASEYAEVSVVPCLSAQAAYRVSRSFTSSGMGETYPGEAYFDSLVIQRCAADTVTFFFPTLDSWRYGDRTVSCLERLR